MSSRSPPPPPASASVSERTLLLSIVGAAALGSAVGFALHSWNLRHNRASRFDAPLPPRDLDLRSHARRLLEADTLARAGRGQIEVPVRFRTPTEADIPALSIQWHNSYNSSAIALCEQPMFPSIESATPLVSSYVRGKVGLLAVTGEGGEEKILASAFQDESDIAETGNVVGCGPWTVTWADTSRGVGRTLLGEAVAQSIARGARSLRLLQGTTNLASMALYSKLGFEIREPLVFFSGALSDELVARTVALHPHWTARELTTPEDARACADLWQRVTGASRAQTIARIAADQSRRTKKWLLLDQRGNVIAFLTGFGSMSSSCASSLAAQQHLLCVASAAHMTSEATRSMPPSLHVCTRLYPTLCTWLRDGGMRVMRSSNLSVLGQWTPIRSGCVYGPSTELN